MPSAFSQRLQTWERDNEQKAPCSLARRPDAEHGCHRPASADHELGSAAERDRDRLVQAERLRSVQQQDRRDQGRAAVAGWSRQRLHRRCGRLPRHGREGRRGAFHCRQAYHQGQQGLPHPRHHQGRVEERARPQVRPVGDVVGARHQVAPPAGGARGEGVPCRAPLPFARFDMSYIERSLGDSAAILYRARFPWFYYAAAWLALAGFLAAGIAAYAYPLLAALTIVAGLVLFIALLEPLWTTEIGVTTQRFIYKRGLLWRTTQELQLRAIEEVNLEQGVLGRLLDFGRLQLHGTGVNDIRLPKLADPVRLRKALQDGIAAAANPANVAPAAAAPAPAASTA